jgi:hypothetical protein
LVFQEHFSEKNIMTTKTHLRIGSTVQIRFSDAYKRAYPSYSSVWEGAIAIVKEFDARKNGDSVTLFVGAQELCIEREHLQKLPLTLS